jgi:hypothetical protein
MTPRFSSVFKSHLLDAETRYATVSPKLGDDFYARVKEAIRTIVVRNGGDHVGPHGYPCRKCRPFPYLVYYEIVGEEVFVLGLVQERRHPDFLKTELRKSGEK